MVLHIGGQPGIGKMADSKRGSTFAGAQRLQLHPDLPGWMAHVGGAAEETPAGATWLPARSAVVLVQRRQ